MCPVGLAGPELIEVKAPDGTPYCIDATEVTFEQYDAFVSAQVDPSSQDWSFGVTRVLTVSLVRAGMARQIG